jgi:hypothetical protein
LEISKYSTSYGYPNVPYGIGKDLIGRAARKLTRKSAGRVCAALSDEQRLGRVFGIDFHSRWFRGQLEPDTGERISPRISNRQEAAFTGRIFYPGFVLVDMPDTGHAVSNIALA